MAKPKYLWHGSIRKMNTIKPSKAVDLSGHPASNKKAVYATDIKALAIEFGLVDRRYKKYADYSKKPVQMVLINGNIRKGKTFYLYKLSSRGFTEAPKGSHQWINLKEVKPIEMQELKVDDYKHLCRKATKKDKEFFESLIGKFG
ncbi:MAG: hypothetical protein KAT43_03540 [Nanoarchaeota archaeon]|nr:hypothetical protein [Nanoarchaeota archaeon]